MEIVIGMIMLIGGSVSGASYFVMKHTSTTPANGEVEHLNRIETAIENLSKT